MLRGGATVQGVYAEAPRQRVLLSWGRSIVGGMYRGHVPQTSPHAQVWASYSLILSRSRMCSDQKEVCSHVAAGQRVLCRVGISGESGDHLQGVEREGIEVLKLLLAGS